MSLFRSWGRSDRAAIVLLVGALCPFQAAAAEEPSEESANPYSVKQPSIVLIDEQLWARDEAGPRKFFDARETIQLIAFDVPCGTSYLFFVDEKVIAEAGVDVRGLDDVQGLVSVVAAAPEAKGLVPLERIGVRADTVESLLRQLATVEGAKNVLADVELLADQAEVAARVRGRDKERYLEFVDRWKEAVEVDVEVDRDEPGEHLKKTLDWLDTPAQIEPTETTADPACGRFRRARTRANAVLLEARGLRREFVASPLSSFPPEMAADSRAAQERLPAIRDYLRRLHAAASIAQKVLISSGTRTEAFYLELNRLAAQAGDSVGRDVLRDLADGYVSSSRIDLGTTIGALQTRTAESGDLRRTIERELKRLVRIGNATAGGKGELDLAFRHYNDGLRQLIERLVDLGETSTRKAELTQLGPYETNQVVTVKVEKIDRLAVPDLSSLDDLTSPFGDVELEGGLAAARIEAPGDGIEIDSKSFEVHKTYRWNAGGGVLLSMLETREFGVRSRPVLGADGAQLTNDAGDPLAESFLAETGSDSNDLDYVAMIEIFANKRRLDVFPGRGAGRHGLGFGLGLSLQDPADNLYLGAFYQPILGVQIIAGLHYGRVEVPQDGFAVGDTLPVAATDPPTRQEWQEDLFVGLVFDGRIFKSFFAGGE